MVLSDVATSATPIEGAPSDRPNLQKHETSKFHKCFKNTIYDILNDFWPSYEAKTTKNSKLWKFLIFI